MSDLPKPPQPTGSEPQIQIDIDEKLLVRLVGNRGVASGHDQRVNPAGLPGLRPTPRHLLHRFALPE